MPRGRNLEKPNNFNKSLKSLLSSLHSFRYLIIIAIILSVFGSLVSLVSPNRLSDITDKITEGIKPNNKKLEEIFSLMLNESIIKEKTPQIITSDLSLEEKNNYQKFLTSMTKDNFLNSLNSLSDNTLNILLSEFKVDDKSITVDDQIKVIRLMSTINIDNEQSLLTAFDNMPSSIYELVKPNMDMDGIKNVAIFLLTIYILGLVFSYLETFILNTVTNKYAYNMRLKMINKINKLPLKYFDTHEIGDILSRITNDIDTISQNLDSSMSTLVSGLTLFVGSIFMMFYTNYIMAITAILSSLLGFLFMGTILSKSQKYFKNRQVYLGKLNSHIEEIYRGHNIVTSYNGEEESLKEFNKLNDLLYDTTIKSRFLTSLMPSIMSFIGNFGYVCVCVVGAILVLNNVISFGVIVAFMIYVRLFTSPLSQIAQSISGLQSSVAAYERIEEFINEEELQTEENVYKLTNKKANGNISFEHVKFGYTDKIIIKDFSVDIKSGQKIAIVGPTGAGKTTLVNLLMKFYEIKDGDIKIDGHSIHELSRENVHNLFTMVLQDTWLFNGTIRDNIKFNRSNITDDQIWEALKTVGIDHYVETLPGGLDAVVDGDSMLSSGEKQLLTIARGMIEDAPFLILDEATSNVDTRTEELVSKAMDKLMKGKTSFIIAHRLSTIKNADIILVLNEGDIIESGNHEELMNKKGFYYDLYNSQFTKNGDNI